jgi:hypothetical protein
MQRALKILLSICKTLSIATVVGLAPYLLPIDFAKIVVAISQLDSILNITPSVKEAEELLSVAAAE